MKPRQSSRRQGGSAGDGSTQVQELKAKRLHFTEAEVDLLLKACSGYRMALPIYLQSSQEELSILDSVIHKLS